MAKKKGVATFVLEYYPDAEAKYIEGQYYIISKGNMLGKSKSKAGAWRAAHNNMKA
jgi:hypothetical protein